MSDNNDDQKLDELAEKAVELKEAEQEQEKSKDSGQVPREVLNAEIEKRRAIEARLETIEREKAGLKEAEVNRQRELDEKAGEFKKVISSQKEEIETLRLKLQNATLDVERLRIGRKAGLPDDIAILVPGDDPDIIRNNAEKLAESVQAKLSAGPLNAGQGNTKTSSKGQIHHSLLDNAI